MTRKCMTMMVVAGLLVVQAKAQETNVLKTESDKISYSIGVDMSKGLKRAGIDIQPESLARGLKDGLSGGPMLMTDDEMKKTLSSLQEEMMKKQGLARNAMEAGGEENKKTGEAFLEANKAKEGVVTLPSGLQYKILKAGDGKKPTDADSVECHYKGTLINGTEFDSSYKRGQPATFAVTGVIPGWTEALQLMPVGSTWQLFIPSKLAYGPRGAGGAIGPNETLIFELELLGTK